jgi:hypothetical protein
MKFAIASGKGPLDIMIGIIICFLATHVDIRTCMKISGKVIYPKSRIKVKNRLGKMNNTTQ